MSWMQFSGVVLLVWAWIVGGAALFSIIADSLAYRQESKLRATDWLVRLWNEGAIWRVR